MLVVLEFDCMGHILNSHIHYYVLAMDTCLKSIKIHSFATIYLLRIVTGLPDRSKHQARTRFNSVSRG